MRGDEVKPDAFFSVHMVGNLRSSQDSGLLSVGYDADCAMIATAIGESLIVRTLQMEIVWEPCFIIQAWCLFSFCYLDQMLTSLMLQDD